MFYLKLYYFLGGEGLKRLKQANNKCFVGRISGAVVKRTIETITLTLKVSRNMNRLGEGIESPPVLIPF
jgi:hypothetical protein